MNASASAISNENQREPGVPHLSVCIPTYNRLGKLRRLLAALLPQLTGACELVILDNCSDEEVAVGIQDLLTGWDKCTVRVMRNPANVGGNANILRCHEVARGEWVWVLGDDDLPVEGAVACLLEESQANPETVFINFGSTILDLKGAVREKTVTADGLEGFIQAFDNFSNLLFISASLYRRPRFISSLRFAYAFIDTCGPHLALLLIALLKDGGQTRFSHRKTIHWDVADNTDQWDLQVVYRKLQRLLDLIPTPELRELWFAKISREAPPPVRTLPSLGKYLISKKGRLDSVRDQLELSAYLGAMVPSYRLHFLGIWFTAYLSSCVWFPFYLAWAMIPSSHPWSLARYGGQSAQLVHKFLEDKRT